LDFLLYLLRWQCSSPILWLVLRKAGNNARGTVIANLIGAVIFYFIDKWIFTK